MATAVGVILIKERHIVDAFERAGATAPDRALPLADVPVEPGGVGMRRLRDRAVVREARPGEYYADLEVWEALRRTRRRLVVVLLVLVGVLGAVLGYGTAAVAVHSP